MLFLSSRRLFCPLLLLFTGANLVISMPAPPPSRRSSEDDEAGFSNVPKILEIQLPLRIATKEDLVAWARYVMGLTASRINITLTTVKESPSRMVEEAEKMSKQIQQSLPVTSSGYRYFDGSSIDGYFAKNFENTRYAGNVRNLGHVVDREKIPAAVRIVESENFVRDGELSREKAAYPRLPTMADGSGSFNDRQPIFRPIFDGTVPLDAPSIRKPGGIKDPDAKDSFDAKSIRSKTGDRQLFVPQFPNFGPAIEPNDIFPNSASPPTRAYLPVTTVSTALTSDNLEFPSHPFVARYLFDNGFEGNVSSNVDPPLEIASLVPSRNASSVTPLFNVPFEAVITFEPHRPRNTEGGNYSVAPSKDDSPPGDRFPPYLDTSSHASTDESGQIHVVLDEGQPIEAGKEERKKQEKKKEEEKSKRNRKSEKNRAASLARLIESLVALRTRNGTNLATNLVPPVPLREQASTQKSPERQRAPPPARTQLYSTENPVSALRQGRRNQTSVAQQQIEGDKEGRSNEVSEEGEDVEIEGGTGNMSNNENASSEENSDEDEDEKGGGPINAILDLLQLAAPILEDLSDPESETEIADVLEVAIPLLQDLSQGDDETPGVDFPGLLVPILLQISGEDGQRDSGAILTPLLQLSAPLIGPLVGPLVVPLSRQSSQPPGQGSSISNLIKGFLAPLLEPIGPYGKMTQLSNLIAGIVSSLSKNSGAGGASDLTSLVKAVVAGSVAGTSAGSSGNKDSYGGQAAYGAGNSYNAYLNAPSKNTSLGSSINDILNAILKVVASLVNAISAILATSSNSSNEQQPHAYPPKPYAKPSMMIRPADYVSITTSKPERLVRV